MAKLIPYGVKADGKYGVLLDDASGYPEAVVVEIWDAYGTNGNGIGGDDFEGRMVYAKAENEVYVYGESAWVPLRKPVDIESGFPSETGSELSGSLYWDTGSRRFYIHDGSDWHLAGGQVGSNIEERRYVANGSQNTFISGVGQTDNAYFEVFIDGARQIPDQEGVRTNDYSVNSAGSIVFSENVPAGAVVYIRSGEPITFANVSYKEEVYDVPARSTSSSNPLMLPDEAYSMVAVDTDDSTFGSRVYLGLNDLKTDRGRRITIVDVAHNANDRNIVLRSGSTTIHTINSASGSVTLIWLGTDYEGNAEGWHVVV